MSNKKKLGIILGSSLGIVLLLGLIAWKTFTSKNLPEDLVDEELIVESAKEQELGDSILVTGQVIPADEQKVFPDAESGEIKQFLVEENQIVKAGDPLFHYDATKITNEYNKTVRERDLANRRVTLEQNQIASMNKQITQMKKGLSASSEYTKEDITALEKEKVALEMEVEAAKSEVAATQESLNDLAEQKKKMTPVSKINGIIVKVNKNVEIAENGNPEPVVHIISNEPFKVIGTMSEFDTVKVQPEQPVIIRPKVYKEREWKGVVESVSQFPEGSESNEGFDGGGNVTMYPFKVAITDDTSDLRQGFHVSLEVNLSDGKKYTAIPHSALLYDYSDDGEEQPYIYLFTEEQKLKKQVVTTGEMSDEFIEITEGLAVDDRYISNAHEGLEDGMEVTSFVEAE